MPLCSHIQWLRVQEAPGDLIIHHGERLQRIARRLPQPTSQYPTLLSFTGAKVKTAALKALFPGNELQNRLNTGLANICIDPCTADDVYPILIADIRERWTVAQREPKLNSCHDDNQYSMPWLDNEEEMSRSQDLSDHLQSRLLLLFTDIFCVFADNDGDITTIISRLKRLASIGSGSTLPVTLRPRVIVVMRLSEIAFQVDNPRVYSEISSIPKFFESFAAVTLVNISQSRPSHAHFQELKSILAQQSHAIREEKKRLRVLFSMDHTAAFFEMALKSFIKQPAIPFNFIKSSRKNSPLDNDLQDHISEFLKLCLQNNLPCSIPPSFVASAIILDSYPPGMHRFDPKRVFRTLYRDHCGRGFRKFNDQQNICTDLVCRDIEMHMLAMFSSMEHDGHSAALVRQQDLQKYRNLWAPFKTTRSCLICLRRKVEHIQSCGHAICDTCVKIYGKPMRGTEYRFSIQSCVMCQSEVMFQAKLSPPTAQKRMLSLDGGGVKVGVALRFLEALDQKLALPYPLQEHFDFGIGTSSGGLAILSFLHEYWKISECLEFLHKFAHRVFPSKQRSSRSFISRNFRLIVSDGQYDAVTLEETLIEAFGTGPLFGVVKNRPSGMKVAITATTISSADLCLFTNYNGVVDVEKDSGYRHLRAYNAENEVLTWEAARCTTAAPGFFRTKALPALGTFQDGGLRYNNPVRPGLREGQRIWKGGNFDFVLSIGTGFHQHEGSPKAPSFRNIFQDGFIARFYRASMSSLSLDGQRSWKDHHQGLEEEVKGRHFRLNLPLTEKEPGLDDVNKMAHLEDLVQNHQGDIDSIFRALIASDFYFELHTRLQRVDGVYSCHGSILCRSPDSRALVQRMLKDYPLVQFVLNNGDFIGLLGLDDICQHCGLFQKTVSFSTRHRDDVENIQLVFNRLFRQSVSSFPQSASWFQEQQMLIAPFGRPDHNTSFEVPPDQCECYKQRYKRLEYIIENEKRGYTGGIEVRRSKRRA